MPVSTTAMTLNKRAQQKKKVQEVTGVRGGGVAAASRTTPPTSPTVSEGASSSRSNLAQPQSRYVCPDAERASVPAGTVCHTISRDLHPQCRPILTPLRPCDPLLWCATGLLSQDRTILQLRNGRVEQHAASNRTVSGFCRLVSGACRDNADARGVFCQQARHGPLGDEPL